MSASATRIGIFFFSVTPAPQLTFDVRRYTPVPWDFYLPLLTLAVSAHQVTHVRVFFSIDGTFDLLNFFQIYTRENCGEPCCTKITFNSLKKNRLIKFSRDTAILRYKRLQSPIIIIIIMLNLQYSSHFTVTVFP